MSSPRVTRPLAAEDGREFQWPEVPKSSYGFNFGTARRPASPRPTGIPKSVPSPKGAPKAAGWPVGLARSPWPSSATKATAPRSPPRGLSPAGKPKAVSTARPSPKAKARPSPKAVQKTVAKPSTSATALMKVQRTIESMFRGIPNRGPPRLDAPQELSPGGSRRSGRVIERSVGTSLGTYWPGGATTPRSKAALMKGGGAGMFQMALSPRAPRSVKKSSVLAQRRMDKWLDPTILNQDPNMWTFSGAYFKTLGRKVGILRSAAMIEPEMRYELSETVRSMVRDTLLYADYARAKTVSTKHVKQMLAKNGLSVWMPPLRMKD